MSTFYTSLARLYDPIYHFRDYPSEAAFLVELARQRGVSGGRWLDAACGTGMHLHAMGEGSFERAGFDASEEMLAIARERLPGTTPLWRAGFTDFEVEQAFDVVSCLFSSIAYLHDVSSLGEAAARFHRALRPGGLLIIEPFYAPEEWDVGRPVLQTYQSPELRIARSCVAGIDGDIALMTLHWLVAERGVQPRHIVDPHRLWLCPHETFKEVFEAAGFEMERSRSGNVPGRPPWIGTRRP